MKLIFAITSSEAADNIADALREGGFRVTIMSSIGGFLRRQNATLMIGLQDEELDRALEIIRANAPPPEQKSSRTFPWGKRQARIGVTVFVVNMPRFERLQP
jgi:uncharacterized protein YaaQ